MSEILRGMDLSYSNSKVDWKKVKNSKKIDFAILRCGFGSESPNQVDNQYRANAKGCIENDIPFGIYHFGYCLSVADAGKEADFAIKLANEFKGKVKFIAYDIEEDTLRYCRQNGVNHTKMSLTACVLNFLGKVKAAGYTPVLYTNYDYIYNRYEYDKLSSYPLWLAYPEMSSAGKECAIWQYSWKGRVDGINGDVDMDFLYDADLIKGKDTESISIKNPTTKPESNVDYQIDTSAVVDYIVKVTSSNGVNLRKGAGTSFKIKGAVPCDIALNITRQTTGNGYTWGYTNYNGTTGWIALEYTEKIIKDEPIYYTVKSDDILTVIAKKYNTTVSQLVALNTIQNITNITTGQKIRVK